MIPTDARGPGAERLVGLAGTEIFAEQRLERVSGIRGGHTHTDALGETRVSAQATANVHIQPIDVSAITAKRRSPMISLHWLY